MSAPQGVPQGIPAGPPPPGSAGAPAFPPMPKWYMGPLDHYGDSLSDAIPDVKKQDIHAEVQALRDSFATGITKDIKMRRQVMTQLKTMIEENADLLAQALWKDLHKCPMEATLTEVVAACSELSSQIDNVDKWSKSEEVETNFLNIPGRSEITPEPFGVVCVIGTWNYPLNLMFMPLAAALSAGNCAIVRMPGEDTTKHLNNVLMGLFDKYADKRIIRYVYGGVDETKAMLQERFDLICATGSQFLGKIVAKAAAEFFTPTILEMGGKNPVIVDASADLDVAAKNIAAGAFVNGGQLCVRPDYVLVDASVGDAFVAKMKAEIVKSFSENPKAVPNFGRIVNQRCYARVHKLLDTDRKWIVHGGESDDAERYIAPTLLNFREDMQSFLASSAMHQEVFAPILPILYAPKDDLAWSMKFVTDRPKPLSLYFFSTIEANKQRVVSNTTSGSVCVNDTTVQLMNNNLPFGGVGDSGMGVYMGHHGFRCFSHNKAVLYK